MIVKSKAYLFCNNILVSSASTSFKIFELTNLQLYVNTSDEGLMKRITFRSDIDFNKRDLFDITMYIYPSSIITNIDKEYSLDYYGTYSIIKMNKVSIPLIINISNESKYVIYMIISYNMENKMIKIPID